MVGGVVKRSIPVDVDEAVAHQDAVVLLGYLPLTRGAHFCTLNDNMYRDSVKTPVQVPGLFTSGEVQKIVGVTQRQLGYWDDSALARPHGRPAQGSGSRRLYTLLDMIQLKLIARLRQAGLSLQKIRRALLSLSDLADEPAPLAELEVITDGRRIFIRRSNELLLDPLAKQYVLRLPLSDLLAEIEKQVPSSSPGRVYEGVEGISSVEVPR